MLMVDGPLRELKSWGLDYIDFIPNRRIPDQLKRYLKNTADNYRQWFDFERFPTAQFPHADDARNYVIGKYQELFRKDKVAAYTEIGGTGSQYLQFKGITSQQIFDAEVEKITSPLWDFVDAK
ncbi:hypothetical protein [Niastella populi]|uniref:Uncharacterized protein n=1 Tax=Niastella populi TaxID=550983 RepID=A0A1V9FGP6_9BACT|nr:hypothetical protein [Niastella populi]OQP57532.1 hypothetical protein A4R26_24485 [Niastella populi]